jgi:hypothetical protein
VRHTVSLSVVRTRGVRLAIAAVLVVTAVVVARALARLAASVHARALDSLGVVCLRLGI